MVDGTRERRVESDARYEVKLLGLTAYRYRHHASERWAGECLAALDARTDDNGAVTQVHARTVDGAFEVAITTPSKPAPPVSASACTMSFAYWNPALSTQQKLLDPGTGLLQDVQIMRIEPASITVHGRNITATGLRIVGLPHPIDLWYEGDEWIGLDTTVRGNRRLTYRLP